MTVKWKKWNGSENDKEIKALWEEYSYRHSLIWRVVFQTTAAVVALSIVPYLEGAKNAGYLRFMPLIFAIWLPAFAYYRMKQEFLAFDPVKKEYLSRTREQGIKTNKSKFKCHTYGYLIALAWVSVIHSVILVLALFIPRLKCILKLGIAA